MHYVSKAGNNGDGSSWASAWSELDQINWSVVRPGDTIQIDGGSNGMTYQSTLSPTVSGTASAPITIAVSTEAGHTGHVTIFGGRSTLLPYCGQPGYVYQTNGVRDMGMYLDTGYIVIDGNVWHGISIYGHNKYGIRLDSNSHNMTIRNVEIYDNGDASMINGGWVPDEKGINLSGANNTVENADIYDNGQDEIQSGGGISNFTLRTSWLHSVRTDPTGAPFNSACQHQDGIQVWGGHVQSGITIEDSIFGPGLMHGVILGDGNSYPSDPWAVVNNVTIRRSLFYRASNANISSNWHLPVKPTGWVIDQVTSYRDPGENSHNVYLEGTGHTVENSIFYGGQNLTFPDGTPAVQGNCQDQITGGVVLGPTLDPEFLNSALNDFIMKLGSPCAGRGAVPVLPTTQGAPVLPSPSVPVISLPPAGAPVAPAALTSKITYGVYLPQVNQTTGS